MLNYRPMPIGVYLQCNIFRKKIGRNKYYNLYTHDKTFLLCAEKKNLAYSISISKCIDNFSEVVGNLNSNFLGTEFNLVDKAQALAAIQYEMNILGIKGPRKMKVYLPGLDESKKPFCIRMDNVRLY